MAVMQQGTGRALDQQLDRGGQSGPGMQPLLDHQPEHHPRAVDAAPELSTGLLLQILKQTHRYCPLVKIENLITRGRVHSTTLTDKFVLGEILGQFLQGMADHRVSLESTTLAWACYRPEHNLLQLGFHNGSVYDYLDARYISRPACVRLQGLLLQSTHSKQLSYPPGPPSLCQLRKLSDIAADSLPVKRLAPRRRAPTTNTLREITNSIRRLFFSTP